MRTNMKKVFILFLGLIIVLSMVASQRIYASVTGDLVTTMDAGDDTHASVGKVNNVVSVIIVIARVIGVTVAIVMLLVVAMKYMTAAPGEKADIKKSAIAYVIGAIALFAVTGLLGLINTFSSAITASP